MKYLTAVMIALKLLTVTLFASDPFTAKEPDVPETATMEIIRRGHSVEEMGTVQAGPEAVANDMTAPPEDDSDRWFITLIVTDDPQWQEACDRARQDINAQKLKGFILPDSPESSWAHYSVRMRFSTPTGKPDPNASFFEKVAPLIDGRPFPAFIVQPPRNGSHGPHKTVAGIVYGYGPDWSTAAAELSQHLTAVIKTYSESQYAKALASGRPIVPIAHAQAPAAANRPKINPPFHVEDKPVDLFQPAKVWPTVAPQPAAKPLTYSEIRKTFPGVPEAVALDYAKRKLTEEQIVEIEHQLLSDEETVQIDGVDSKPANPTPWQDVAIPILIGLSLIGIAYVVIRRRTTK